MKLRRLILGIALSAVSGGALGQGLLTGDRSLLIVATLALLAGGLLALTAALGAARVAERLPLPVPPFPPRGKKRPRLGEILIRKRLINQSQLEQALARQRVTGQKLGEILVEMGVLKEFVLRHFLERPEDPWKEQG